MQVIALFGDDGRLVCERCEVADTHVARARGLLGRRTITDDAGLLIRGCSSIHTCFMRFSIDAVFLDRDLRVLRVVSPLRPWRAAFCRHASAVAELASGAALRMGIQEGEQLAWATPTAAGVPAAA